MIWPVNGKVVSSYGTSGGQKNDGIDIAAAKGTPVKAAEGGKVVYAGGEVARMGNLLLIEHPGGYITAYGNNEVAAREEGRHGQEGPDHRQGRQFRRNGRAAAPFRGPPLRQDHRSDDGARRAIGRGRSSLRRSRTLL